MLVAMQGIPDLGKERVVPGGVGKVPDRALAFWTPMPAFQDQIQRGLVDSTAATKPHAQGYWAVVNLWQQHLGAPAIERIDTGIRFHVGGASPKGLND